MTSIRSFVEQQMNELELLRCCYSSADEFHLDDIEAFNEAKDFLDGKLEIIQRNLSFRLKFFLNDAKRTIELQFIYPLHYPQSPVDIHLRTYISRECYEKFQELVKKFLKTKTPAEEAYVLEFLAWIQDNQDVFLLSNDAISNEQTVEKKKCYSRLWIYSHHIYNIEKRRHIVHWAEELHLNGFSLPGKPGIICVEGEDADVEDYWTRLRNLTWKKLQMKEKELLGDEKDKILRFNRFEELNVLLDQHGKGDFGQFYQYLQGKQLETMFHLFFGFDGTEKK